VTFSDTGGPPPPPHSLPFALNKVHYINGKIRRLTPRECARVQGFDEDFKINKNSSQAYKQFGNSVSINVLQRIMMEVQKILLKNEQRTIKRFADSKEWVS
jgi:DNA (cytosine-5)-methyltransferase 1